MLSFLHSTVRAQGKPGLVLKKNRLNNKQKPPSLSREREINNDSEAQL